MSRPRAAVATLVATAAICLTAAPPALAAASQDWEAHGSGQTAASFALSTVKVGKGAAAKAVREITDLVVQASINCADSPTPAIPVDTEIISNTIKLASNGTFTEGSIKHGSGTTVSGSLLGRALKLTYHHEVTTVNEFDGGDEVCNTGTVHLTGAPGTRPTRAGTTWEGETQSGEPVQLHLVAGGRALQEPRYVPSNGGAQASISFGTFTQTCFTSGCTPSSDDICAYETPVNLFVAANGSFGTAAFTEGDQASFEGSFGGARSVNGTFNNGAEGCAETTWTAAPAASANSG